MSFRTPKGTDDIMPPESRLWRSVLRAWDILAERYGYAYVATPIFESTDLFARGMGETTEVVEKQMYNFLDKGGRRLTLRPEITAGVVRAYIQAGRWGEFKGAYSGPCFRYERPQEGRRRQFWQLGVEYLGTPDVEADLEVIELGYRYLLDCGLGDVVVHVNSIGDPPDRLAYHSVLSAWLEDRADQLSRDARRRIRTNPLRVLDSKADREVVAGAPVPVDHLGEAAAAHHDDLIEGLQERGIAYDEDPRLVRGLDYYNRTVFEYIPPSYRAAQNAVGGGGRYDGLSRLLGGPDVPGVGLALGLDRILSAVGSRPPARALDVFLVVADQDRRSLAQAFARRLRSAGVRCDLVAGRRSVKAQFRAANRRDAAAAVVIGSEWDAGLVTVKDLSSGDERTMPAGEVVPWVKGVPVGGGR
ncbi:MAG: histidine--tRNA ligase [bacterium]|nr:histidine--tRNA ligase [bacterium]MDE0288374.1 histidine--tRNA ligase [bacterium]MDE0438702.1 histidine--tRNA ligase [bacterium]